MEEAVEAAKVGFARFPGRCWPRGRGEARPRSRSRVRCLQRPDGGLPASEDEPDIVATVARSY